MLCVFLQVCVGAASANLLQAESGAEMEKEMKCQKCGAEIEVGSRFCEVCGTPVAQGNASFEQNAGGSMPHQTQAYSYQGNNGDYDTGVRFDTKKIRQWFKGKPKWPVICTVLLAIYFIFYNYILSEMSYYGDIGITTRIFNWPFFFLCVCIALWVYTWSQVASVSEVDRAWNAYVDILSKRGLGKLNLIKEEVSVVDPVVLVGFGEAPDITFDIAKTQKQTGRVGFLGKLFLWMYAWPAMLILKVFKRSDGTELDPYVAERIAEDDIVRSLLISVSVYMFSERQLFVYTGNLDISTGLIYSERTEEVFYQDISGVKFNQSLFKLYSMRVKRYVNKARETMELYLPGCSIHTSYRTELDTSILKEKFAAMRNLIRDKKEQ